MGTYSGHVHKGTEGAQVCSICAALAVLPVRGDADVPRVNNPLKAHVTYRCHGNEGRAETGRKAREQREMEGIEDRGQKFVECLCTLSP